MPSEVDICNLALAHLGDTASIASLTENSVQARLCRQFYPVSRDALLEMNAWGFSTRRAALSQVSYTCAQWQFAYGMPVGVLNLLAVLPSDAPADIEANLSAPVNYPWPEGYVPAPGAIVYTPQPYTIEIDDKGNQIILTNQCNALLRFTMKVTDTGKFSPLFVLALSYLLASMLAGPILKGDAGAEQSMRMLKLFQAIDAQAEVSDANQVNVTPTPAVSWIAGR